MSEKRDLWVPLTLAAAGLGLTAWNVAEGRILVGVLSLLIGLGGALGCLPLRVKRGQARVVGFGMGVALLLAPTAPGLAESFVEASGWLLASIPFLLPLGTLAQEVRIGLLVGAAAFAVLALLALRGVLPTALTWPLLAGAFALAGEVFASRPRAAPPPPVGPRIGLFGGSFDPFHNGHRMVVEAALKVVDRVLVVPAGRAPHKPEREPTPFHHRVAMARLGVEGLARTEVLELEGRRAGPSYTVDTLETVSKTFPEGTRLLLVVGADMLQIFPSWHEWERILEMADLLVAERPGSEARAPEALLAYRPKLHRMEAPQVDVSSTQVREALARGDSVSDLVPPNVRAYARDHALYG